MADEMVDLMAVLSVLPWVVVWVVSKVVQWGGLLAVDSVDWTESYLVGGTVA